MAVRENGTIMLYNMLGCIKYVKYTWLNKHFVLYTHIFHITCVYAMLYALSLFVFLLLYYPCCIPGLVFSFSLYIFILNGKHILISLDREYSF